MRQSLLYIKQTKRSFTNTFVLLLGVLFTSLSAYGQFTITDDFRSQGSPDIVIGDNAYFTSGIDDPVGAGWLRLTKALGNQKGYAYINKSFPSTLGLLVDFEYTMWRNNNDTYNGADGLSLFLFDANYGPGNFSLGAYGGSLGYANSTQSSPQTGGVTGGYVGVGFDAYGNFVRSSESKNGGSSNVSPNSIALRGPTTSTNPSDTNTNRYLAGVTILDNGNIVDALNMSGNASHNIIDYNTTVSSRPSYTTFYRRVQLEIIPTIDNKFRIVVRWSRSHGGAFTQLIDYTTTDIPPSLLKLGFAASTGGGFNNHEIRNLLVTTPRNLRVTKKANKDILRTVPVGTNANQITYTIEVINDTDDAYTDATFSDELLDINGDPIPTSMFTINSITHSGFSSININQLSGQNKIEGNLSVPANVTGYITVTGTLNEMPLSNMLQNRVEVLPTNGVDFDLGNNIATVNTPVIAENVDLTLTKRTIGESCIDPVAGNTHEISVVNMGALPATYRRTGNNNSNNKNRIVVIKDVPTGYSYDDSGTPGGFTTDLNTTTGSQRWTKVIQPNTPTAGFTRYIYIARGASNSDQTLAGMGTTMPYPIRYTLTPPTGVTSYVDETRVEYRGANGNIAYNGANIESTYSPSNTANNTHSETMYSSPPAPVVSNTTIYYCIGETAEPLSAETISTDATLLWYTNIGGTAETVAPTPLTTTDGTYSYYVSQTRGSCESPLQAITVVVLPTPTAGTVGNTQVLCSDASPAAFTNISAGTAPGWPAGRVISYEWEQSSDNGTTWTTIASAVSATYLPPAQSQFGLWQYRRRTVATVDGHTCYSPFTDGVSLEVITPNPGAISGNQTVCAEQAIAAFTSTTLGESTPGTTISYRWEVQSPGGTTWVTASGTANTSSHSPAPITQTGEWKYRRVTIATNSAVACEAISDEITVTINDCLLITNPMTRQRVK